MSQKNEFIHQLYFGNPKKWIHKILKCFVCSLLCSMRINFITSLIEKIVKNYGY